jgi:serpin B
MAALLAGARGRTASQLAEALHLTLDQEKLHAGFAEWTRELTVASGKHGNVLRVANALWAQEGCGLRREFTNLLAKNYGCELETIDFREPERAASRINDWVARKTERKITRMVSPGDIGPLTRLVLANALYCKGKWDSPFELGRTHDAPFSLEGGSSPGRTAQVPMMTQEGEFRYGEGDTFQAVELPYRGHSFSMTIFLPKKESTVGRVVRGVLRRGLAHGGQSAPDGLAAFEETFTFENFERWRPRGDHRKVKVFLPRFTMDYKSGLTGVLRALGVTDVFTAGEADLSGVNGRKDLFVGDVAHGARVEVNEEGTEAAAYTRVMIALGMGREPKPVIFRADHPFMFLIRHTTSGGILFIGRVSDPTLG